MPASRLSDAGLAPLLPLLPALTPRPLLCRYVAMGFVATAGRKVPSTKVMRCVRADAVGRQPGYTGRANWLLPAHRNRAPLAAWLGDDRLGTFLAAVPTSPPQPEDMYRLRVLDEGGECTGEQRQQAQKVKGLAKL